MCSCVLALIRHRSLLSSAPIPGVSFFPLKRVTNGYRAEEPKAYMDVNPDYDENINLIKESKIPNGEEKGKTKKFRF